MTIQDRSLKIFSFSRKHLVRWVHHVQSYSPSNTLHMLGGTYVHKHPFSGYFLFFLLKHGRRQELGIIDDHLGCKKILTALHTFNAHFLLKDGRTQKGKWCMGMGQIAHFCWVYKSLIDMRNTKKKLNCPIGCNFVFSIRVLKKLKQVQIAIFGVIMSSYSQLNES